MSPPLSDSFDYFCRLRLHKSTYYNTKLCDLLYALYFYLSRIYFKCRVFTCNVVFIHCNTANSTSANI